MSRKLIMSNKFQCSNTEIPKWTHLASSRLNLHHCSTTNAHGHKCLLSTHAHRQGVDILATVFAILCVCVCTVTDFSTADRASSVKFCRAVHRRPRQAITHFGEFCSPRRSPRNQNALAGPVHWPANVLAWPVRWPARRPGQPAHWPGQRTAWSMCWPIHPAPWPCVGSACVDIRPFPIMDVVAFLQLLQAAQKGTFGITEASAGFYRAKTHQCHNVQTVLEWWLHWLCDN